MKARFYKRHIDSVNKKKIRLSIERDHLINVYNISPYLVDDVINSLKGIKIINNYVEIDKEKELYPDYNYEKEMLYSFEEFKTELIYDEMEDLASIISLEHFYHLFSPGYIPSF